MGRNWCWNYFIIDKKDSKKGICKFCGQSYGCGNVERMINHLAKVCKKIPANARVEIDNKLDQIKKKHRRETPVTTKTPTPSCSRGGSVMNFLDSMDENSQKLNDELLTRVYFRSY